MTETVPSGSETRLIRSHVSWFSPDNRLLMIAALLLGGVLIVWVMYTPGGLLGKADAIGYAVCHRIQARSFLFPNGRPLPLCARCSGTFLGVLIGLLGPGLIFRRRHAALMPPVGILAIMLFMSFLWAFDGTNSFSFLLPFENVPHLYQPSNFLRVVTGMFHGITLGGLILPVTNATVWEDLQETRTISNLRELLILYALGVLLIALMLTGQAVFLYPLAILSAAGTVFILTMVNAVITASLLRRANKSRTLRDALPLFMIGLALTFILIGGIDAARFAFFGTWDGITTFPNA